MIKLTAEPLGVASKRQNDQFFGSDQGRADPLSHCDEQVGL
jgi:hypothetical protein